MSGSVTREPPEMTAVCSLETFINSWLLVKLIRSSFRDANNSHLRFQGLVFLFLMHESSGL